MTSHRARLMATTLLVSSAFAAPALAQEAAPAAVQEVVVTGSRIPQPNLTSTSPLTVVNSQELKLQGTTNVESLLNNLPQVVATQTSQVSNGSDGTAAVDLRNLGTQRTLVLVDGKRLQPGDPQTGGVADLNNIPSALVDRIDVVTGGASSVYGSDAIAGVVNFILKKNFQGLRIDAQGGFFNHQNSNPQADAALAAAPYAAPKPGDVTAAGFTYDVTAILGANLPDDRGNVTAFASYRHLDPVLQKDYDYTSCPIASSGQSASGVNYSNHVCGGSSNTAYGRFDNTSRSAAAPSGVPQIDNPNGTKTFVPYTGAFAYNFNPLNFLQREDTTYHAGYFARYDITKSVEVYSDFLFLDDETHAQVAPSGAFAVKGPNLTTGLTFNCNNPLIGPSQAAVLCPGSVITPGAPGGDTTMQSIRYRFATVPRNADLRHTDYKIDIGVRGDFADAWHYDAYLQYGTSIDTNVGTGDVSLQRLQNSLNVVNNAQGQPVCVTSDSGCVPLDIFAALGKNFSPAALKYVLASNIGTGESIEQIAEANLTGDLGHYGIKSPWASEGVGVALGSTYRREQVAAVFDSETTSGDLSGSGGANPPASGSFDVYEIYAEGRAPLISDRPFVRDLSVDAAYRFSDYSSAGKTDTYKAEANYTPFDSLRFRFSYNRAVRAPSAFELFTPQHVGLAGYQDPCSGSTPLFSEAQCVATGLNPALYGQVSPCASAQCNVLFGGNPDVKPELADTYSVGLVFTPSFFRGFNASLDYFNINVQNVIDGGAGPTTVLQFCAQGQASYCALIHRDASGTINSAQGYIDQVNTNSGSLETRGVDFTANYRTAFADWRVPYVSSFPGSLAFNLVGTYTENFIFQPIVGQGHYDCAGYFGVTCGVPQPHWRSELRTSWITPWNVTVSLNWRYLGASKLDLNQASPFLNGGPGFFDNADARIGDYNYFDLSGTWRVKDRYTIRAGVNNIFDKDPPIIDSAYLGVSAPPFGNGNTYPGVYDALGRTIFIGLTADF